MHDVPAAIIHDYLTQRVGAERLVLTMLKAFSSAPIIPAAPPLRRRRMALPILAYTFSQLRGGLTLSSATPAPKRTAPA